MSDRLPYTLSKDITATREGLQFASPLMPIVEYFPYGISDLDDPLTIPWSAVAERLLYRDGEPWCHAETWDDTILCGDTEGDFGPDLGSGGIALDIIAAIVVGGNPESLRVLHWCIHNLALD